MAGAIEETGVSIYCNWKNLTMLNYFLRPKVFGLTLVGSTDLEEVDVYMHHPSEIFGSEPEWQHKFFFTHKITYRNSKAKGGYWRRNGPLKIIRENDGTLIGFKERRVFREVTSIRNTQRTNWHLNQYELLEGQPLESNGFNYDNNKIWVLCELFQPMEVSQSYSEEFLVDSSTHADDQSLEAMSIPASEQEQFEQHPGIAAGPSVSEGVDQMPRASDGGQGDAQSSAWSVDWANKWMEDSTSEDYDVDFMAILNMLDSPPHL